MKNIEIKNLLIGMLATVLFFACTESNAPNNEPEGEITFEIIEQEVEAACGQCKLGLEGSGCDLAVRIDGGVFFVDGTKIDDHGDVHAEDGLCTAIRRAQLSGQVDNGRFVVKSFERLAGEK